MATDDAATAEGGRRYTKETDEGRRYTKENPHPADEELSEELKEYIYGEPDEVPELDPDDFGVDRPDPLFDGERIHLDGGEE